MKTRVRFFLFCTTVTVKISQGGLQNLNRGQGGLNLTHGIKFLLSPRASLKNMQVPHTSRKEVSSLKNLRGKRSSIPLQNTRPESPEPTQQGPCDPSQIQRQEVRSGTLRFLPQLEMRPSSIAPNPEESREAPPNSTVSLTSQRHPEKLPDVTGTSKGNPGFPAATLERPRESFFNPS